MRPEFGYFICVTVLKETDKVLRRCIGLDVVPNTVCNHSGNEDNS